MLCVNMFKSVNMFIAGKIYVILIYILQSTGIPEESDGSLTAETRVEFCGQ